VALYQKPLKNSFVGLKFFIIWTRSSMVTADLSLTGIARPESIVIYG